MDDKYLWSDIHEQRFIDGLGKNEFTQTVNPERLSAVRQDLLRKYIAAQRRRKTCLGINLDVCQAYAILALSREINKGGKYVF